MAPIPWHSAEFWAEKAGVWPSCLPVCMCVSKPGPTQVEQWKGSDAGDQALIWTHC